jgi:SAM-dependent methyltransferase
MLNDADCSIDHVITADVLEHVRRGDRAFREIHRVLKPGGYFFLQVPYAREKATEVLVEVDGDRDIYLCPPQYHYEGHAGVPDLRPRPAAPARVARLLRRARGPGPARWVAPRMNMIVCRKGAAIADDPAGAIRFEREWSR